MVTVLWFLVGILPIPVALYLSGSNAPHPRWLDFQTLLIFCFACNVIGGIGCLGRIKDQALRLFFGFLLGVLFFLICTVTALFAACSHMNT